MIVRFKQFVFRTGFKGKPEKWRINLDAAMMMSKTPKFAIVKIAQNQNNANKILMLLQDACCDSKVQ